MGIWDSCSATGIEGFLLNRGDVGFLLCQGDKRVPLSHRELLNQIIFL